MKLSKFSIALIGALLMTGLYAGQATAKLYRVTSIAPGLSPFVVNTSIAKVVNKHLDGVEMQVRATGAATRHVVEAAKGKVDFFFGSPTINWIMANNLGPYKKMKEAPELEKQLGMIFSYQIGPYHYIVRADSGIQELKDLKGKKVFVGPPGGAARGVVLRAIKANTGLTDKDFQMQNFGFDAAIQAFQDDKIDVVVLPTNVPSPSVEQFVLTKKIRLLSVDPSKMKINAKIGATVNKIAADAYGGNQVNTKAATTHGAIVNFSARMDLPEEVVYQVTKTIWENIDEVNSAAKWMPSTIQLESGVSVIPSRLHPGAERYYREIGVKIPKPFTYGKKK